MKRASMSKLIFGRGNIKIYGFSTNAFMGGFLVMKLQVYQIAVVGIYNEVVLSKY